MLFLLISLVASAQKEYDSKISEINNTVYAMDYIGSREAVLKFITSPGVKVIYQSEYDKSLEINLTLSPDAYKRYDSLVEAIGYSSSKNIRIQESETKLNDIELELAFLRQKRDSYTQLSEKLDPATSGFFSIWNEIQVTSEKIFALERERLALQSNADTYSASLSLHDEVTSPQNTGVSFVNMPGFEYSFLDIETPLEGISADYYHGYSLKYLFTKGKSYANIGIYKNDKIGNSDSIAFSELFILGFGQDFYSRHFGRGSRKFLNLYSGYNVGCMFATSTVNTEYLPYLAPSVGVEIFKNKYILIDTKVSYIVPVLNSRNMRGISYGAAFNFVF